MSAIVFRLLLLAGGLGFGQLGLDSLARGAGIAALMELALATAMLVAGSAGFIVPLLDGNAGKEVSHDA